MKIEEQKLPESLEVCPIGSATVEIRFTSTLLRQAVFGIIYGELSRAYPIVENLPIAQLPQTILETDPNVKFKPYYRLSGNGFLVQIGPDVISVSPEIKMGSEYPGWSKFFPEIERVFNALEKVKAVKGISRLGIRYSNFFVASDIFQDLNLKIQYNNETIPYSKTILRTELESNGFANTLQVSNNASRQSADYLEMGSLIDIDTFKDYSPEIALTAVFADIQNGHKVEKQIFWNLLGDKFKEALKPTFI